MENTSKQLSATKPELLLQEIALTRPACEQLLRDTHLATMKSLSDMPHAVNNVRFRKSLCVNPQRSVYAQNDKKLKLDVVHAVGLCRSAGVAHQLRRILLDLEAVGKEQHRWIFALIYEIRLTQAEVQPVDTTTLLARNHDPETT